LFGLGQLVSLGAKWQSIVIKFHLWGIIQSKKTTSVELPKFNNVNYELPRLHHD